MKVGINIETVNDVAFSRSHRNMMYYLGLSYKQKSLQEFIISERLKLYYGATNEAVYICIDEYI